MGRRSYRTINIEKVAGVLTLDQLTRFIINSDDKVDNYWFDDINEASANSDWLILTNDRGISDPIEGCNLLDAVSNALESIKGES